MAISVTKVFPDRASKNARMEIAISWSTSGGDSPADTMEFAVGGQVCDVINKTQYSGTYTLSTVKLPAGASVGACDVTVHNLRTGNTGTLTGGFTYLDSTASAVKRWYYDGRGDGGTYWLSSSPSSGQAAAGALTGATKTGSNVGAITHRLTNTRWAPGSAESFLSIAANSATILRMVTTTKLFGVRSYAAGTWKLGVCARPYSGTVYYTNFAAYFYRPGTGIVGYAVDTSTLQTGPLPLDQFYTLIGEVSGSEVTGIQDGDVLIVEHWLRSGAGSAYSSAWMGGSVDPAATQHVANANYSWWVDAPYDLWPEAGGPPAGAGGSGAMVMCVT